MRIKFGEWLPDQPALSNPGATLVKNVLPYAQAYGQLRSLSSFTGALAAACTGAIWAKDLDGDTYNHAGTASALYQLGTDYDWDDVSQAGGYNNVAAWEWTQYGNRLIAVDISDAPQYYDLGTSALYADLPGSPPKAAHIGSIRNFVVLGNLVDGLNEYPNRLHWSGYNNTELWTPSRSTQSDRRDLEGRGGKIQRIVPGQYGVIFQENSIQLMEYSGPPTIFTLREVDPGRGAISAQSVCWSGANVFYLSHDGFYRFGQGSTPIGTEKIDKWFFNEVSPAAVTDVRGVVDRTNKLVLWMFKTDSSLAYNNRLLIYNWAVDKWSHAEINLECISEFLSLPVTLDGLDVVLPNGIDIDSIPVDSPAFQGGSLSMVGFGTDHKAATFSGDPLVAELETVELGEGNRFSVRNARPLIDGGATVTIADGYRNSQSDNYTYSALKPLTDLGMANFRNNARYHRLKVRVSGGFTHAIGVDADAAPGGSR